MGKKCAQVFCKTCMVRAFRKCLKFATNQHTSLFLQAVYLGLTLHFDLESCATAWPIRFGFCGRTSYFTTPDVGLCPRHSPAADRPTDRLS